MTAKFLRNILFGTFAFAFGKNAIEKQWSILYSISSSLRFFAAMINFGKRFILKIFQITENQSWRQQRKFPLYYQHQGILLLSLTIAPFRLCSPRSQSISFQFLRVSLIIKESETKKCAMINSQQQAFTEELNAAVATWERDVVGSLYDVHAAAELP